MGCRMRQLTAMTSDRNVFFPSPGAHRGSDADFDGSQGLVHQWRDQTLRGAGKGWRTYETHLANEYDIYIYTYTI